MDAVLKRLLDAEQQAEALIAEAKQQRDELLGNVHDEVAEVEAEFRESDRQGRAKEIAHAEERAAKAVEELGRRQGEQQRHMHEVAQQNEQEALEAALELFIRGEQ